MEPPSTLQDAGDLARAELANLLDLQLSPLGMAAMDALAPEPEQTVRSGMSILACGGASAADMEQVADLTKLVWNARAGGGA